MHRHHCAELVLVTAGRCRTDTPAGSLMLDTGGLAVIPPEAPHNQVADGSVRTIYVGFRCEESLLHVSPRVIETGARPELRNLMDLIVELYTTNRGLDPSVLPATLLAALSLIRTIEAPAGLERPAHPRLAHAVEILRGHLSDPMDAESLAKLVALSPSHLTALFRAEYGCGPMHYLQSLRIELARRLLGEPYLTVKDVAARCGYANVNLFIRHFRNHCGSTPGTWRAHPSRLNDT